MYNLFLTKLENIFRVSQNTHSSGLKLVFVLILVFVIDNVSFAQQAVDPGIERLRNEITRLSRPAGGSVGVAAIHLESGMEFYINKDEKYPMASTYKVPIAVQLLTRVENGEISLNDMISLVESDLHPGSGTLSRLLDDPGVILSIHNLMELMLLISDNSATDLVLRSAGGSEAVTERMRRIGIEGITVNRPTFVLIADWVGISSYKEGDIFSREEYRALTRKLSQEDRAKAARNFNLDLKDTATPYAMAQLLRKIWQREILNDRYTDLLIDVLRRVQTGTGRIKGMLPQRTTVYHKTGTIGGTTNDVGVIELPGGAGNVITVVFIKEARGNSENSERVIAQISRSIYDYFLFTAKE